MYKSGKFIIRNCKLVEIVAPTTVPRRWKKKKEHWSVLAKKKYPVDKALEHFDDFYKTVYGNRWPSIRLALLSPHKYCAVVNNFATTESTVSHLESIGAVNLKTLFKLEKERIIQGKQEAKRKSDLEKIFELDRKLENIAQSKQEEERLSFYAQKGDHERTETPPVSSITSINEDDISIKEGKQQENALSKLSLHSSIEHAEMEVQRIIDPASGLSAAALYEFVPATKLKGMDNWVTESQHYRYYNNDTDFPVKVVNDCDFLFPEYLQVFSFEQGNISRFPSPKQDITGVLNYYLLDGSSLLPVLALDLRPGDRVLDMCAAPGGKSLIMLQTLFPAYLVCNDISLSRTNRIQYVLKQYLYDLDDWKNRVIITQKDGRHIEDYNAFNKILVDVPCTTDRHSLHENDNNIFAPGRTKERLQIPEIQSELLFQALKLVQPGGTVIYSTCSLSPIQNDGVVHMALHKIWQDTEIEIVVKDMTAALQPVQSSFKFGENLGLRYGHLVLPFLPCNFGPMYFCKLVKTK